MQIKSVLSGKIHAGPGGIDCPCCRPRKCNKKDVKVLTARSNRRKARQINWE